MTRTRGPQFPVLKSPRPGVKGLWGTGDYRVINDCDQPFQRVVGAGTGWEEPLQTVLGEEEWQWTPRFFLSTQLPVKSNQATAVEV